jgi:disulfide bond formation protein DsbB
LRAAADPLREPAYRLAGGTLLVAIAAILTALAFEHIGGYRPCPLCLQQRYAYYASIPLLFLGSVLLSAQRRGPAAALFLVVSFLFLLNAGLGVYHAGVEWKFWPGPDTCGGADTLRTSVSDFRRALETGGRAIRCDEAPWRMFGLSFAGWNVVVSLILWITSLQAAFAAPLALVREKSSKTLT